MLGTKGIAIAVEQTIGRQSLNIHGAINLETGQTQMLEVTKVNAMSLIALLKAIEAAHPAKKRIHVYLDNASYHHANIVRDWLESVGPIIPAAGVDLDAFIDNMKLDPIPVE